ncbi:hypothetical protein L9F63_018490 [Diploptera punctata]|uniref:DUF4485 domain-containing protein n=1 Tax=Diploptera punctata TaxID=6984 RepID=A0AAD8EFU0_DIPPU|nr:hypothetical protein L9F63_018490 [Diploptera punctata]
MEAEEDQPVGEAAPTSPRASRGSRTSRTSRASQGSRASVEPTTNADEVEKQEENEEVAGQTTEVEQEEKPLSQKGTSKSPSVSIPENVEVASKTSSLSKRDPLITEFIYYSAMLKCLSPALTSEADRCLVIPWIRKLFGPEYQVEKFRTKRNKYLCSLTITLLNDEVSGVFKNPPPPGALYEVEDLACENYDKAEWETDDTWDEICQNMPDSYFSCKCTIHSRGECSQEEDKSHEMLDQEFRLFLYLVRPYAALMENPEDKAKVSSWIQLLCCVPKKCCLGMKSLRNDYMRSLYGCVHDLYVSFPFCEFAPSPPLPVPHILAKGQPPKQRFTDPTSKEANEFLKTQPIPENGAFCYLAVSGDVLSCSVPLEPEFSTSFPKERKPRGDGSRHVEIRSSHLETTAEVDEIEKLTPCQKNRSSGR